jgi:hypothetical protein
MDQTEPKTEASEEKPSTKKGILFLLAIGGPLALIIAGVLYLRNNVARQEVHIEKVIFISNANLNPKTIALWERNSGPKAEENVSKLRSELRAAESKFMSACLKCAAAEACERDRLTILGGQGSSSYNPCE